MLTSQTQHENNILKGLLQMGENLYGSSIQVWG
jgi:hypothetical protein